MFNKNKKRTKRINKKIVLLVLILLLLVGIGGYIYLDQKKSAQPKNPTTDINKVNYGPPTQEELDETDAHKKALDEQSKNNVTAPTPENKKTVSPTITYAGQYGSQVEASAFVSGIFEDGGKCNFVFKQNQTTIEKSTSAFKDATTSRCTNLSLPSSQFAKGTWSATVTYSSNVAGGVSKSVSFEVK